MKNSVILAATGLFAALTSAVPLDRRDLRLVTETQLVMKTDWVVETVWVHADGSPYTAAHTHTTPASPAASHYVPVASVAAVSSKAPKLKPAPAPSSVYVAPAPSSKPYIPAAIAPPPSTPAAIAPPHSAPAPIAPAPSTPVAPAPAPSAPAAPPGGSTGSGIAAAGTSYTGDLTYYGTGLGSCGWTSGYDDHIVAISHIIMDAYYTANPNDNPLCGKMVNIKYGGQSFPAKVVDRCTGCAQGDLDLSEGFFSTVTNGDIAAGRIGGVQWDWVD